mmetsp:Transcript_12377/g.19889  ORF Transcript_12377/g.19889 Transcript_12377/m.19889 type:complete len:242 (-) Transcript_12377:766-1491(-)
MSQIAWAGGRGPKTTTGISFAFVSSLSLFLSSSSFVVVDPSVLTRLRACSSVASLLLLPATASCCCFFFSPVVFVVAPFASAAAALLPLASCSAMSCRSRETAFTHCVTFNEIPTYEKVCSSLSSSGMISTPIDISPTTPCVKTLTLSSLSMGPRAILGLSVYIRSCFADLQLLVSLPEGWEKSAHLRSWRGKVLIKGISNKAFTSLVFFLGLFLFFLLCAIIVRMAARSATRIAFDISPP